MRRDISYGLRKLIENKFTDFTEIAKDLNISSATLIEWTNGTKCPTQGTVERLADYFGVSVDDLYKKDPCIKPIVVRNKTKTNNVSQLPYSQELISFLAGDFTVMGKKLSYRKKTKMLQEIFKIIGA